MIVILEHTVGLIVETKGLDYLASLYPKAMLMETRKEPKIKYYLVIEDETVSDNSENQQPATDPGSRQD